eukprot:CAMPEP_0182907822 /NCGR_PEP_ID=MMETSP0034_2-20130328/34779_1 /TAXON_ID=156128 /ORGANISM="Nephroselmis pyriformis, Strain CCMP717" /LENGTH=36 /DNA_ID= /DNA_START= /DNA_END= /DNA_ORIENTATION=
MTESAKSLAKTRTLGDEEAEGQGLRVEGRRGATEGV